MADLKETDPPVEAGSIADPQSPREPLPDPSRDHSHDPHRQPHHTRNKDLSGDTLTAESLEAMAAPQAGQSQLELLPTELLMITVEALISGNLDLKDIAAYRAYKCSLRNLCLVSRAMAVIAKEALYRDVRLYGHMAVVRLYATFCLAPKLASHVKSILFCPPDYRWGEMRSIDLRPLRPFKDPDYAFWTRGRSKAKIRMPQKTREELVCILFAKVLSRIPALDSLYLKLPELHPITSGCLERLPADPQFMQQLSLQASLFQDFCQGRLLPNLSKLSTFGMMGEEPVYNVKGLRENLFHSPNLHEVRCVGRDLCCSPFHIWNSTLQDWDVLTTGSKDSESNPGYLVTNGFDFVLFSTDIRSTLQGTTRISTSVKRMELRNLFITAEHIVTFTTVFPSLESLGMDDCLVYGYANSLTAADRQRLFQLLGGLENFHTLELDSPREPFAEDIITESGPSTVVTMSALSRLRTLLVPVDFLVGFTSYDKKPHIHRATTLLPDSLRHLTLLLDYQCKLRLSSQGSIPIGTDRVTRMVEPFLRQVAPALLIEFPHLEQVDLCYDMQDYRQHRVHTLAARSTAIEEAAS